MLWLILNRKEGKTNIAKRACPLSGQAQVLAKTLYIEHVMFKRGRGNKLSTELTVSEPWLLRLLMVKNKAANLQS